MKYKEPKRQVSVNTSCCSKGPSHQSNMTDRTPWWKAFLPKKKSGGSKDLATASIGPDFNPFAEKQNNPTAVASRPTDDQTSTQSSKSSSLLSDETFDDSQLEPVFNEQTCRRHMKVSRSGRFKEKRRARSTLPIEEKGTENVPAGKEDKR
ncbi:hypothetical protein OJAV_G00111820 [Oryzias javanicus]|uniref:Proline-rich protein 15 n=1 Tax=Oryzias javanicus TaxID=123683 RepID=A0A437CVA6_ORYJA|nr:hypothetical protein OJAV_G00111820 [Oryzias javanicus]